MVNGAPREFPRVLDVLPREKIEGPPRDFLKANPRPHPRPDQRPKTRGAISFLQSTISEEEEKKYV